MSPVSSLQNEAYQYLKEQIDAGRFETDRIYSLNAIASMLNISRTPVRDALKRLSQEELIEILPSRGFRLQQISEKDIMELYQLRCAIEGYCCYYLAPRYQKEAVFPVMAQLKANLEMQAAAIKAAVSPQEFLKLDREFHSIIISSAENQRFSDVIEFNRTRIDSFSLWSLDSLGVLKTTLQEHQKIYDAIRTGDPTASQQAMLEHLDTPLQINLKRRKL